MDIAYSKNRCQMFVLKLSGIKKYLKGWLMFWQCIKLQWERWYGISIDYIWDQYFPYVEHWYVISISICRYISKCTKGFKFNVSKFSSGWEGRGDVSVQKKSTDWPEKSWRVHISTIIEPFIKTKIHYLNVTISKLLIKQREQI